MPAQDIEALTGVDLSDFQAVLRKYFKPNRSFATYATYSSFTSVIPVDDTIPQITEGTQLLSVSILPTLVTNKIRVEALLQCSAGGVFNAVSALFHNGGANAVAANFNTVAFTNEGVQPSLCYEHVPGALTVQTYALRVGPGEAGTIYVNGNSSNRLFGGVLSCTLSAEEIFVP